MTYQVFFTADAKHDIQELKEYVIHTWSKQVWKTASDMLKNNIENLAAYPHVGTVCSDLAVIGISQYRQLVAGTNYLVYEADDIKRLIYVHVVCDQRRDLESLLLRRLLRGSQHPIVS